MGTSILKDFFTACVDRGGDGRSWAFPIDPLIDSHSNNQPICTTDRTGSRIYMKDIYINIIYYVVITIQQVQCIKAKRRI